jgi:hypothetical protein
MRFGIGPKSIFDALTSVLLRVVAGHSQRNAWRGMRLAARPKIWFGASLAVAAAWSLFLGALLIDLILKI